MFLKYIQKLKLNGRFVIKKILLVCPKYFLKYTPIFMKFITGNRAMYVIMC